VPELDIYKTTSMKKLVLSLLLIATCGAFSGIFAQEHDTLKADDILKMSLIDLMNVRVVSASKVRQSIKDVSATVQVITATQIRDRSYFTLEEALGDLPGFQFRNIVGFNSYVFMRGAPSQNNLILLLVDGIQINELNSGGFYGGGQFNMSNIERIEVVYGPASPVYGTNAVSGIVNIITKRAEGGRKGHISLLGGSFKTGMAEFNLKNYNTDKDIGYSISGMYKTSEKADLRGSKGDFNWTDQMENFENDLSLSARFVFKDLNVGITYQQKQSSMTTNTKSTGSEYLDKNTLWNIAFLNSYVKYSSNSNKKLQFASTLYYRNATVINNTIYQIEKATDTTSGNQIGYYRPNQLAGIESQLNYKATRKIMITGGIVGEFEQLSNGFSMSNSNSEFLSPPKPARPVMLDNYLFSYFLQASYKISDKFSFIGGLRHDFSSYYGQVLTPRTGLVYNSEKITAKFMYNRAFRAPKPWDYKYGTGNDNLKPEKMHSFELFFSYALGDYLSLGTSLYRNIINDKLILESTGNTDKWINRDELNTMGIELYGNYTKGDVSVYMNYTYTNSYEEDGIQFPEVSMHTANAGITWSLNSHIKMNFRTNYMGARTNPSIIPATGNDKIDDAMLFHGTLSYYNFKKFDIQLKANNIFNEVYYHPSNRFAGRYRQPQRTLMLMITYNLF